MKLSDFINLTHDPLFCRRDRSLYSALLFLVAYCVAITRDTYLCRNCAEPRTECCERSRVSWKQLQSTTPMPYWTFLRQKLSREKRIKVFFCDCELSMWAFNEETPKMEVNGSNLNLHWNNGDWRSNIYYAYTGSDRKIWRFLSYNKMKSILSFYVEFITKIIFISKHFNYIIHCGRN